MIKWLTIHNLALIDSADIEFSSGFNAVTGETGAGKSVLMSGIKLLLGARFDKDSIRAGEKRCEVAGEFAIPPEVAESVRSILEEYGIEETADLLIRRVFTSSGGRAFVNTSPVPAKLLSDLGELLADIHNANETAGLMKTSEQLESLDRFANAGTEKLACKNAWIEFKKAQENLKAFMDSMPSPAEAQSLRADIAAIDKIDPHPGEDVEMERTHEAAANFREILETAQGATAALTESDQSILDSMTQVRRMLQSAERSDPESMAEFIRRCDSIQDEITRLSSDISDRASQVELDPESFAALEERMTAVQTLKRKFGPELSDVLDYREKSSSRLEAFENSETVRNDLENAVNAAASAHEKTCQTLSGLRKKAASGLSGELKKEIIKLGFKHADFDIGFSQTEPGPNGTDKIEFLFSANPGVGLKPLRAVASSGELSRVMLAVKTVLAGADRIGTLIFDEIDANIGGETAVTVANELAALAKHKQILSISHLAQVAAHAETHFEVRKITTDDKAVSTVRRIEGADRVKEIARMLGGGKAADTHAQALLK